MSNLEFGFTYVNSDTWNVFIKPENARIDYNIDHVLRRAAGQPDLSKNVIPTLVSYPRSDRTKIKSKFC